MKKSKNINAISFKNSGKFLKWWFENQQLKEKNLLIFEKYYKNYKDNFNGYLENAWSDRHMELDQAIGEYCSQSSVKFLDIGCGTGSIALYVAGKFHKNIELIGIDINSDRLNCALERKKILEKELKINVKCKFINSNILTFNKENNFDLIYMEETFHHLEPRLYIVQKVTDLLKKGGTLIISEVNAYNPLMQLYLFMKRGIRTIEKRTSLDGQTLIYGIERIARAGRIVKLFNGMGLKLISLRYFRVTPTKFVIYANRRDIDLMPIEKIIFKLPFLKYPFAVHYNAVFKK